MKRQNLDKFFQDPDWIVVENILKDCVNENFTEPDETLAPADFKAQVLANKKLIASIQQFLSQAKLVNKVNLQKSVNPFE